MTTDPRESSEAVKQAVLMTIGTIAMVSAFALVFTIPNSQTLVRAIGYVAIMLALAMISVVTLSAAVRPYIKGDHSAE